MGRRQHLRPGALVPVGSDEFWIFDVFHPVAAVLDRSDGTLRTLVSWPELPAPAEGWRIAVHGSEVWVQPAPTGPLIRLDSTGVLSAHALGNCRLAAAGPDGAWCVPRPPVRDLADHPGVPPRTGMAMREDRILLVSPHDQHRSVTVPGRVRQLVRSTSGGIDLEVDTPPWYRRALHGRPRVVDGVELGTWEAVWESAWLHLPDGFSGGNADMVVHGISAPAFHPAAGTVTNTGDVPTWHRPESAVRDGRRVAGLAWVAGWEPGEVGIPDYRRSSVVTGHDPVTGECRARAELGPGRLSSMAVAGDDLAFVVFRHGARWSAEVRGQLIRLAARTGQWTVVSDLPVIDLGSRGWPLVPRPIEAASHERSCLRAWAAVVESYWHGKEGTEPLARGVGDTTLELTGSWPDTQVRLTFTFDRRPGRRLVHGCDVYDDLGRPVPSGDDLIHLMEHLETGLRHHREGTDGELLV